MSDANFSSPVPTSLRDFRLDVEMSFMLGIKPQFPDGMRMGSDYHDVPYSLQAARGGGGGQSQTRVGPTKFHHYPYPRESRGSGSFRVYVT